MERFLDTHPDAPALDCRSATVQADFGLAVLRQRHAQTGTWERLGPGWRFVSIVLHEPHQSRLADWSDGDPFDREAFMVLRNRETRGTYEAVVSLTDGVVRRFEKFEGVQASITFEEFMAVEDLVRADPQWQAAMRLRGVEDFDHREGRGPAAAAARRVNDLHRRHYEYGFFWHLYTDGTIEFEVKLTGCLTTNALPVGQDTPYGQVLAPGLYAPHHQHFFSARLDMAIDGIGNRVVEVDSVPDAVGPENPDGNWWMPRKTVLASESVAQRTVDPTKGRFWKIENPNVMNAVGEPVAYKLMPGENVFAMPSPDGNFGRRSGFIQKHLWVTRYDPDERFPAGDYPAQHPGGAGLPAWAQTDRGLDDEDLVVWYSLGAHHVVRTEDWPVMPVHHIGFKLKPAGFFAGNPALDMPATMATHCHGHGA